MKTRHDPATCTGSPEGQPSPGLHPQQRGQQGKGRDFAPLLYSAETVLGVLRPAQEPSAHQRHGPVGEGPEEATAMIGGLEQLSSRKGWKSWGFSAWKSKGSRQTLLQPSST